MAERASVEAWRLPRIAERVPVYVRVISIWSNGMIPSISERAAVTVRVVKLSSPVSK